MGGTGSIGETGSMGETGSLVLPTGTVVYFALPTLLETWWVGLVRAPDFPLRNGYSNFSKGIVIGTDDLLFQLPKPRASKADPVLC
jgi:hypothetical protein